MVILPTPSLVVPTDDEDFLHALESFIGAYKEQRRAEASAAVPLNLFADRNLGSLEVAVKYLKENRSLSYKQIALLLNRDQRTIWTTYRHATRKRKEPFMPRDDGHAIPCAVLSDRSQGPLEAVVRYLKDDLGLSFKQIAACLQRHYNTIWLTYKNGKHHG